MFLLFFIVKVRVMGAGVDTYVPIRYGEGYSSCCPWGYGFGYVAMEKGIVLPYP